jgi:hypothetical protein
MAQDRQMRTLIYKRTHEGDPDPETGVFGNRDCMKTVRGWKFDAVIGIGGIGRVAKSNGIDGRLTWIGIGPHKTDEPCPLVTFEHFLYYEKDAPFLEAIAENLARHMLYDSNVRLLIDSLSSEERQEVDGILDRAWDAPPSPQLAQRDFRPTTGKCRSNSCRSLGAE